MTSTDGEWPPYDDFGSKDHLHAIGVIAAGWNFIETRYQAFTQLIFPHHPKASIRVFELLGNEGRWQLIRDELAPSLPESESELLLHFLKAAAICKENRNAVVHAQFFIVEDPNLLGLGKGRTKTLDAIRRYSFDVSSLRAIADEIREVGWFGLNLFASIQVRVSNESWLQAGVATRFSFPLPEKPPLPC
jgi:hypothetical protein